MRLLFVADGRSPTTLSWLDHWSHSGDEIHFISTRPCERPPGISSFFIIPMAFSGSVVNQKLSIKKSKITYLRGIMRILRYFLEPIRLPRYQKKFLQIVESIRPDLVHALRIPFEGMISCVTPKEIPLFVSIWGNDITLHAAGSISMGKYTSQVLRRADALLADTYRDIQLGKRWGLRPNVKTLVVPGSGGIRLQELKAIRKSAILTERTQDLYSIVNARGQRPGSLRQDIFFRSIPFVIHAIPEANFYCPALLGDAESERWVELLDLKKHVCLLPNLPQKDLWALFSTTKVYVSPSLHDGVPNSLLEAIALGCFPVVGNIESMQEWITNGVNGFLVDATDVRAISNAIIGALNNPAMQKTAAEINMGLVAERADYTRNMHRVGELYNGAI